MAGLQEEAKWEDEIYQLEAEDLVEGGPEGIDNVQARQLANRTQFLRRQTGVASDTSLGLFRSDTTPGYVSVEPHTGRAKANKLPELIPDKDEQWRRIQSLEGWGGNLKDSIYTDVTDNPFLVGFDARIGWELISGCYQPSLGRLSCGAAGGV